MPSIQDVKDAVNAAVLQVQTAITTAVTAETAVVVAQIKAIPPGTSITQADIDSIVASVQGIGPAAATAIDSIATNDGGAPPAPAVPPAPGA